MNFNCLFSTLNTRLWNFFLISESTSSSTYSPFLIAHKFLCRSGNYMKEQNISPRPHLVTTCQKRFDTNGVSATVRRLWTELMRFFLRRVLYCGSVRSRSTKSAKPSDADSAKIVRCGCNLLCIPRSIVPLTPSKGQTLKLSPPCCSGWFVEGSSGTLGSPWKFSVDVLKYFQLMWDVYASLKMTMHLETMRWTWSTCTISFMELGVYKRNGWCRHLQS